MNPLFEVLLTQEELDHLHIVFGFCTSPQALSVLDKIDKLVSDENYNRYDKIKFSFDQEGGFPNFMILEVD